MTLLALFACTLFIVCLVGFLGSFLGELLGKRLTCSSPKYRCPECQAGLGKQEEGQIEEFQARVGPVKPPICYSCWQKRRKAPSP